ncbi:MAG: hypothetical protein ACYC6G_02255 [Desulfobaccales bacterium]
MAMNSGRLISQHPLANGLILELWDHSRPVAGDRWYVNLSTRIAVPVRADTLPPELKALADQVVTALGEEIIFTHTEERNFIGAAEFPGLLQEMQDRILKLAAAYFGHPDFAARFIRGKFAELQKLEHWQRLDARRDSAG